MVLFVGMSAIHSLTKMNNESTQSSRQELTFLLTGLGVENILQLMKVIHRMTDKTTQVEIDTMNLFNKF